MRLNHGLSYEAPLMLVFAPARREWCTTEAAGARTLVDERTLLAALTSIVWAPPHRALHSSSGLQMKTRSHEHVYFVTSTKYRRSRLGFEAD